MRALIQRVNEASVCIVDEEPAYAEGELVGQCGHGLLILLGVGDGDDAVAAEKLWHKASGLRIFDDADGKTNLSLADVGGSVLIISQFTLYANCKRGRRPSFTEAAAPALGEKLYERFCELAERDLGAERVGRGVFGAHMQVGLVNDGPFTVWLDTDEL